MNRCVPLALIVLSALAVLITASLPTSATAADDGWIVLFDGKTLDGWERHSGTAEYAVEDGAIVGHTVPGSPNTFLCTKDEYKDFELMFEVQCDPRLNSGVQVRSNLKKQGKIEDRVFGPQVEIEVGPGEAGYIYGEAFGGWLSKDKSEKVTLKKDDWNQYRVLAKGNNIKTWVNGQPVADLTNDKVDQSGIIGLQVHGVGGRKDPLYVRWRNIKIRPLD